jgi:hypothetical protein
MIPILAIVLDSAVGQALANRIARGQKEDGSPEMSGRVEQLEAEVKYLGESLESLREETDFVRHLIEGSDGNDRSRLEPGD